jgi:hypothetical protein
MTAYEHRTGSREADSDIELIPKIISCTRVTGARGECSGHGVTVLMRWDVVMVISDWASGGRGIALP